MENKADVIEINKNKMLTPIASNIKIKKADMIKDILSLQEIVNTQEAKYYELSQINEDLMQKVHFHEKKILSRREEELKMQKDWQLIEHHLSKCEEELFTLKCIKEKYDEMRIKMSELEKEKFSQKIRIGDLEHELSNKEKSLSDYNDHLEKIEQRKVSLSNENAILRRDRFATTDGFIKAGSSEVNMDAFMKKIAEKDVIISEKSKEVIELIKKIEEIKDKNEEMDDQDLILTLTASLEMEKAKCEELAGKLSLMEIELQNDRSKAENQSLTLLSKTSSWSKQRETKIRHLEESVKLLTYDNEKKESELKVALHDKVVINQKINNLKKKLAERELESTKIQDDLTSMLAKRDEELHKEKKAIITSNTTIKSLTKENSYLISQIEELKVWVSSLENKKPKVNLNASDDESLQKSFSNKNVLSKIEKNVQKITSLIINIHQKSVTVSEDISEIFPNYSNKRSFKSRSSNEKNDSTKDKSGNSVWVDSGILSLLNELQDNVSQAQIELTEEEESTNRDKETVNEIHEKYTESDKSQKLLQDHFKEIEKFENQISFLKTEKNKLESKIFEMDQAKAKLEKDKNQQCSQSTQGLIRANKRIEELEKIEKELRDKIDSYNSEKLFFSKDLYSAEIEISLLKSKIKEQKSKFEDYDKNFSHLNLDYKTLLSGLNLLIDQNKKFKKDLNSMINGESNMNIEKLENEVYTNKKIIANLEDRMKIIDIKEKGLIHFDQELEKLHLRFSESIVSSGKLNDANSLQFLVKENEHLRSSQAELMDKLRFKSNEINESSHRLMIKSIEMDELKSKIQRIESENSKLNDRIKELEMNNSMDAKKSKIFDSNINFSNPINSTLNNVTYSGDYTKSIKQLGLTDNQTMFPPYPYERQASTNLQYNNAPNTARINTSVDERTPVSNQSNQNFGIQSNNTNAIERLEKGNMMSFHQPKDSQTFTNSNFQYKSQQFQNSMFPSGNLGRISNLNLGKGKGQFNYK